MNKRCDDGMYAAYIPRPASPGIRRRDLAYAAYIDLPGSRKMLTVTMLNQKGGVGKTSCTHHLSGTLATTFRKRVLVIDTDPQASLTQGWWGPNETEALDPADTVAAILAGDMPSPKRVIRPTGVEGISIVAGSAVADDYNHAKPLTRGRAAVETIREFLAEVEGDYDVALIDCPPNLNGCGVASMVASDALMIPVQPEDYGSQGIPRVLNMLESIRSVGYPIRLLGILLTMVAARRAIHQVYEGRIRAEYGDSVFTARMPVLPEYPEAIAGRMTIVQYKPKGAAAKAVKAIAEEFLARIEPATAEGVAA